MFKFFRARAADPITSFKAADSVEDMCKQHHDLIVAALKNIGPLGKDGISKYTGLQSNQVARRMNELQKLDLIELTGQTVKSNSGRQEREWRYKPTQERLF
jgi:predicted ArsR family transcriptional regulator